MSSKCTHSTMALYKFPVTVAIKLKSLAPPVWNGLPFKLYF